MGDGYCIMRLERLGLRASPTCGSVQGEQKAKKVKKYLARSASGS